MKIASLLSLALSALSSAPLAVPYQLIDRRDIDDERKRRVENDVVTSVMGRAMFIIVMQGDSLVATLQPSPRPDGTPILPSTMSARSSASGAMFVQKQMPQINVDGEKWPEEAMIAHTRQPTGEASSGTLRRALPMLPEQPVPAPVTGTRCKE